MNYLVKGVKNHQKTGSDLNGKSKKKVKPSSAMNFKPNLINMRGNAVSNSIKKKFFGKGKKIIGIKNYIKTNNLSENNNNNTRDSNKKIILSEFKINEESKGDIDIYDENSTNNLTSTGINNESLLNNGNTYFKRAVLSSSKNINDSDLNNNNTDNNIIKRDINLKNYNAKINNGKEDGHVINQVYNKKNSKDCLLVYKSQSNKEIKNNKSNDNINNHNNLSINNIEINNRNDITQRCRHKQVKREIYINNSINNKVKIINNSIINSMRKSKNDQISLEDNKSNEFDGAQSESQSNSRASNKNTKMPITKINKNNNNNNSKKQQQSLLELYANKNKSNKKSLKNNKSEGINKENNNIEKNDSENKNNGVSKLNTINDKIKRIKSSYRYSNVENNDTNISKDNLNNLEIETTKTNYNTRKINDNMHINKCKSINKMNTEQNDLKNNEIVNNNVNYTTNYRKRQFKRIKNFTDKNHKENDICFYEEELDENTLSITNGKYIDNKKCPTMINKVFHFETGSNEIFNNFRTNNNINSINNMNFLNKNQSTKNMQDKKNSCNTIINGNYSNNNNINNNSNIKNINIIIKNNIDYNLNRKKKMQNENPLKKCNTDIIMDNNTTNDNIKKNNNNYEYLYYQQIDNDDNIINQENYSSESNSNSINLNQNIINNNKNLTMHKKLLHTRYNNKKYLYKIFQCPKFINILFEFCDTNLLNKICLLSKQMHHFMKPVIYTHIEENIFKSNKNHKNLKIKKYLMEKYSPLSKFSPALIRKKYTDLKFENNHKYDTEIKKDLTRTFPDNVLFKYGNNYYNKLYHVLAAFSNYNKNIGYTQGLNFLAAHIIYFFDEEIDEFIFLDALIHKFDLEKILCSTNSNFFIKKLDDINKYIKQKMPKLTRYLTSMKLNYEFFTTNWLLTLFSNSMETKNLFYIWDYMIIFGWKFFKCFVVAVLEEFQNEILKATQTNITFIMKNMLKNKQFNDNFKNIIKKTIPILIEENNKI